MRACFPLHFAVILGTNEIASAVAVRLHRNGYRTVLSHDPLPPVMRRKMAFSDALYDEGVMVDGVGARRADTGFEIRAGLTQPSGIFVTELGLLDLIVIQEIDVLIDARMQKYLATPDLRRLGRLTIGLGPGFASGSNCNIAIETRPARAGHIVHGGSTDRPDGVSPPLGGHAGERFVRAEFAGRWNTAIEIGTRVFKDFVVGHLGSVPVRAPFDGILRGSVRDGTVVPAGSKLIEIDSRGRRAQWAGTDERGRLIAAAVVGAVSAQTALPDAAAPSFHLVK